MSEISLSVPSFAKINWRLRVLGRRADGLHEIQTIFQTITLHDNLTFTALPSGALSLACNSPDIPLDDRNLVIRAALALRQRFAVDRGASIALDKHIPTEAGLGGGSSNAAVALLALARLWQIDTNKDELAEIASTLGADVPFFLTGGTALGVGRGTEITPLPDTESRSLVVVTPGAKVSTAEAYEALKAPSLTKNGGDSMLSVSHACAESADSAPDALQNDFETVVFSARPETRLVKDALIEAGARKALLAGSGSSVFGIFDNREAQDHAVEALRSRGGWRVSACATLARAGYLEALGPLASLLRCSPF